MLNPIKHRTRDQYDPLRRITFVIVKVEVFASKSISGKRVISTPFSNNIYFGSLSLLPTSINSQIDDSIKKKSIKL